MENNLMLDNSIVIYETDNNVNVEAYLENENIWLNQEQMNNCKGW